MGNSQAFESNTGDWNSTYGCCHLSGTTKIKTIRRKEIDVNGMSLLGTGNLTCSGPFVPSCRRELNAAIKKVQGLDCIELLNINLLPRFVTVKVSDSEGRRITLEAGKYRSVKKIHHTFSPLNMTIKDFKRTMRAVSKQYEPSKESSVTLLSNVWEKIAL